jgi:hypothetical protein
MPKTNSHAKARNFVLWALAFIAWNAAFLLGADACWSWWKGDREEVYADCREVQAELDQFKAIHGRYPNTLHEAGINPTRRHSEVTSYRNCGYYFQARISGNFYGFWYSNHHGWDPDDRFGNGG